MTTKWQPDKAIFDALFHDGFVNVVMSHSVEETLKLYEQFKPKGVDLGDLAPLFWSAGLVTHPQFATITRSYIRNRYLSRNVHLWLISSFFFTDGMFARIMRQYKHFSAGQVYAGITLNVYKRPKSGIVMSSFELYNPHYCGYQQLPWMINLAGIPIWSRSGLGSESVVGFGIHNTHNPAVQQRDDIMLVSYITPPILTSLLVGSIFSHRVHLFWPDKLFEDVVVTESNNQSAANTTLRATAHCTSTQCECECKATRISASNMRYWLVGKFKDCYIAVLFTKAYTCSDEVDKASYFIPQIDGPKVPISRLYCDEKQVSIVLVIATIADYPTINDFLKQRLELISVRETVNEVNSIYNIEIDDKSKNIKIDYSCDINNPYRE